MKQDETTPGGRYLVDGVWVDAEGRPFDAVLPGILRYADKKRWEQEFERQTGLSYPLAMAEHLQRRV